MAPKKTSPDEPDGHQARAKYFIDENGWKTFILNGDALLDIADEMRSLIFAKKDTNCPKYRFDFKNVKSIDTVTLSVFFSLGKTLGCQTKTNQLEIVNASEEVTKLLQEKWIGGYYKISKTPYQSPPEMQPEIQTANREVKKSGEKKHDKKIPMEKVLDATDKTAEKAKVKTDENAPTNYHTILFPGDITGGSADILTQMLDDIINKGPSNCIFNLSRVKDIDLAGLTVVNSFCENIVKKGNLKRIGIINASEDIESLFLKTGMENFYLLNNRRES